MMTTPDKNNHDAEQLSRQEVDSASRVKEDTQMHLSESLDTTANKTESENSQIPGSQVDVVPVEEKSCGAVTNNKDACGTANVSDQAAAPATTAVAVDQDDVAVSEPLTAQGLIPQFTPGQRSMVKRVLLGVILCVLAVLGFVTYETSSFLLNGGSDGDPTEVVFFIQPGTGFDEVAKELYTQGVISDVQKFRLLAKFRGDSGKVQAGEFLLNTGWQPAHVLDQITKGRPILYKLVIREGLTWWETARAIEEQGFASFDDFKEVIHDKNFLREHYIPFDSAEGFLFPETYSLPKPRNMSKEEEKKQAKRIASMMVRMFWSKSQPLWEDFPARSQTLSGTFVPPAEHKIIWPPDASESKLSNPGDVDPDALFTWITLASLVEKETSIASERGVVAGVFANRLRKGMLLQCDPTIVYGIGEEFSGSIRFSHLRDSANRYNTYIHGGLPPGPIASVGLASLKAAFSPTVHKYYYFVATGVDGGHTFSRTLGEHNQAVQEYRRNIRGGD